ncbi:UDP-galactopyranose mutase [uncultured Oscillibacter sp.]|uniref:UDP-galactopyranose mutase n=1 Tax=uncultured Oscillibacter sp. TaxID=876091 RepID=UPI0025EF794A|nr:UDP-galactopyranose mutase [uncultured Oscillibacter sp.]
MDCLIVGCGLCGTVIARTLAEAGWKITIIEKRPHIGGNLYDFFNEDGILVQKYGPHSFFTDRSDIKEYIEQFIPVEASYLEYLTYINGQYLPMPFNFKTIDLLYSHDQAQLLKKQLTEAFPGQEIVSVTDILHHSNPIISQYGRFMYENEYRLYTAKQWGRPIEGISTDVFHRVPVYLSYRKEYQRHPYQFIPQGGFTSMIEKMLCHPNIKVLLNQDAENVLTLDASEHGILWNQKKLKCPVVYTGAADALFHYQYGELPYRSLEFLWKTVQKESVQDAPVVAYPQLDKITRVTEYTKLPPQAANGKTVIAVEIPFEYERNAPCGNEPYYPIVNAQTQERYAKYQALAKEYPQLYLAGRLADYTYYNMDHAIIRAWSIASKIQQEKDLKNYEKNCGRCSDL